MAKAQRTEATSRIRFIMLDAEIPTGDIQQVTQAIQNALRPAQVVAPRLAMRALPANGENLEGAPGPETDDLDTLDNDVDDPIANAGKRRADGSSKPRAYRSPRVLEVDLSSGTSWDSFAAAMSPDSDWDRFLMAAAWFKEHRDTDAITADHVYTCYRALKWPAAIDDFGAPLRSLKKNQYMTSSARGQYAINHLGIAKVEELRRG